MIPSPPVLTLVTGATGKQGGAVARQLLDAGLRVRAFTRDATNPAAKALADRGADVVIGDLQAEASVRNALGGADAVFSVQTPAEAGVAGEIRQGKLLIDLADDAGVKHFVYSSVGSAHRRTGVPHFDSKYEIEEHLRASRLPHTVLRPVYLMENWDYTREPLSTGILPTPLSPGTVLQQVTVEDVGAFASMAITDPGRWIGRAIDLAGDELSMEGTAAVFGRVMGQPVKVEQIPWEFLRTQVDDDQYRMYQWFESTGFDADLPELRTLRPDLISLETYLRGHGWAAPSTS